MKFPFKANICTKNIRKKQGNAGGIQKSGQTSISGTQTAGKTVATHENCQDTQ